MTNYELGFCKKAEEYGIAPEALLKYAAFTYDPDEDAVRARSEQTARQEEAEKKRQAFERTAAENRRLRAEM